MYDVERQRETYSPGVELLLDGEHGEVALAGRHAQRAATLAEELQALRRRLAAAPEIHLSTANTN